MTDNFDSGRVDVDDLLSSNNESFRQSLIHIITERRAPTNYAQAAGGGALPDAVYHAAHGAGHTAERDHLRRDLHDNTIGDPVEDGAAMTKTFTSSRGYRIVHRYRLSQDNQLMSGTSLSFAPTTQRSGTTRSAPSARPRTTSLDVGAARRRPRTATDISGVRPLKYHAANRGTSAAAFSAGGASGWSSVTAYGQSVP